MPDHLGNAVKRQAVLAQGVLGYLDGDLERPRSEDLGEGHVRQGHDLLPELVGEFLHGRLVEIASKLHVDHGVAEPGLGDDRALGLGGEGRDAVHGELHLVHLLRDIDPRFQVDEHRAPAFATGRAHLAHALDGLHGFLDPQEHALLHLFRRRAAVGHLDLDLVADELGKRLLLDLPEQGVGAETDDADHHQVGGDVVLREPADQAMDFVCPRLPGYFACVTHC